MGEVGAEPDRERLLIVDDESGMRDVLEIKLGREGYAVATAENARQAAERIACGGLDLVLLDIRLPDGSGLDLLKRLRQTQSPLDLPVIVLSGYDQSDEVVNALRSGANDYVTKPFDMAVVLARIRAQLALSRMKRVNDHFLRIASHDLKKPVMLMLDVARQIRTEYPPGRAMDDDARSALGLLIESGEFMQHILGDLLELRSIRDGRLKFTRLPTDLGAVVRQAVARNTSYAQSKGMTLGMQFGKDLPAIPADDFRLLQVLENLIGNAIKFSPTSAQIFVNTRLDGDALLCEVSDTGPGIPEDEMNRLFTEYAQLSNRPTGGEKSTGLGLAISRELVRLHGGEIGARNNPGGGATFWFRLPLA